MHGNMQLIVELYKNDQISSVILNTCIEDLLSEPNNQNIEILCKMLGKLGDFLYKKAKNESELLSAGLRVATAPNPKGK